MLWTVVIILIIIILIVVILKVLLNVIFILPFTFSIANEQLPVSHMIGLMGLHSNPLPLY